MSKRFCLYTVAILVIAILAMPFLMRIGQFAMIPHGYDGVVATTLEVEHNYDTVHEFNTGLAMGIDPYDNTGYQPPMETGLRLSITSPQYVRSEDRVLTLDPERYTDENGEEWVKTTTQKVSKMTFEMTMILSTYGEGFLAIQDVTFWILLKNNDFSVFTGPDDTAISIINVYNMERPYISQTGETVDFEPESGGADFPLHTIDGAKVSDFPDWAADEYNLENLKRLSTIKFPLYVLEADPTTVSIIDWTRVEVQVEFTIGIDVMLFGEWRELRPYRDVEPPDPDLTWWEMFMEALGGGLTVIYLIVFVLVGIIGTAIALLKMRRNAVPAIVVLWAGILFLLWWLGVF